MNNSQKQDELMEAMQDEANLEQLYDVWRILKSAPSKAVEILVQFKDVSGALKVAVADIQDALSRFDAVKTRVRDIADVGKQIHEMNRMIKDVDDSKVLNRINRIIELAEKVSQLKALGAFDTLQKLMSP